MSKKKKVFRNLIPLLLFTLVLTAFLPLKVQAASRKNQSITASNITVTVGDKSKKVNAKAKTSLSYKSSNPSVCGVSPQGKLTPKKGGSVKLTIYAKATSKYNSTKKTVTVKVNRKNQSISASNKTVYAGDYGKKISAKAKTRLSYKSSNPSVCGVSSNGTLTPKRAGTVKVTVYAKATSQYNSAKRTVAVTVKKRNPKKVVLKLGKAYRDYDVTGDQKKDSILITKSGRYTLYLYVNSRRQLLTTDFSEYCGVDLELHTLENGKPFLYINSKCMEMGNDGVCGVYQYQSGRMKQIIDMGHFFGEYGTLQQGKVLDVHKNSMKIRLHIMSFSTASSWIDFEYTYRDGTLKRKSDIGSYHSMGIPNRKGIVSKTIPVYKDAGSNTRVCTLKKGNGVAILRCKCIGNKMYIEVSYNGKKGWIEAQNRQDREKQFSNAYYAS